MKQIITSALKYKLAILFLFAFLIRLIHLDQSLWLDEATTAMTVKTYSLWQIVTTFSPQDFHPPLYYLFMDIWTLVFGYSEISLRMPSVLFSLLGGVFIYKTAQLITGSRVGARDDEVSGGNDLAFWSAAFFLLNPLIVYYSQEARMYAMVTFFVAASFYYLVKVIGQEGKRSDGRSTRAEPLVKEILLMTLFLILCFYTFYASIFYIAAVYGYLLYMRHWKVVIGSLVIWLLSFIPLAPLLYTQYSGSKIALAQVANWSLVLGNVSLKNLLLIPLKFTSGRISFEPKMLYYVLSGGWMMVVGGLIAAKSWNSRLRNVHFVTILRENNKEHSESRMTMVLLYFLLFPLVLGTIFSFLSPLLQYFRFQYLIVFLSMLLGISVCHSRPRSGIHAVSRIPTSHSYDGRSKSGMTAILPLFVLSGFTIWSLVYLLNPAFHREDWKSLAESLKQEKSPVYMIMSSSDPMRYYAPEVEVRDLRSLNMDSRSGSEMTESIIVIPYTADIHGVSYRNDLGIHGYAHHDTITARELSYELWKR